MNKSFLNNYYFVGFFKNEYMNRILHGFQLHFIVVVTHGNLVIFAAEI
jgi:hypothetical protein